MGPTFVVAHAAGHRRRCRGRRARLHDRARNHSTRAIRGAAIEELDNKVAAAVQYAMRAGHDRLIRQATYWLIQRHRKELGIEQQVARLRPGIRELARAPLQWLQGRIARLRDARDASWRRRACRPTWHVASRPVRHCTARRTSSSSRRPEADGRGRRARLFRHRCALRARLAARPHRGARYRRSLAGGRTRQPARGTVRGAPQPRAGVCSKRHARRDPPRPSTNGWCRARRRLHHARAVVNDMRSQTAGIDFASLSVALQAVRAPCHRARARR